MWFIFALTFAVTSSTSVVIAKKIMQEADEYLYLWLFGLFTLPFLLLIILYFFQIPSYDNVFLVTMAGSILLDVVAAVFAYRAIKISDISMVAPLSAFNPVFTAIISFFTLGEVINTKGIIGILLICAGAYVLQLSKIKRGWIEPLKQFSTNRGVQLSLIAYFIWSITPILQKTAILHTNPQVPPFASFSGMIGTFTIYTFLTTKLSRNKIKLIKKYFLLLLLVGLLGGVGQAAAFTAFSLTKLGLTTAVFKLSMIFTVILGGLFFKEQGIKDRLLGSAIMLLGTFLLVVK